MIKTKMVHAHMRAAWGYADTSYAVRLKVGALLVNKMTDQPVALGWNGMEPGQPNVCEETVNGKLVSKAGVVHAEINALRRMPKRTPSEYFMLFVTHSPCPVCAQEIVRSGIKTVVYGEEFRDMGGVDYLLENGVQVFRCSTDIKEVTFLDGTYHLKTAQVNERGVLQCNAQKELDKVGGAGIKNMYAAWTRPEINSIINMFGYGREPEKISIMTDRSVGSICTMLERYGHLNREPLAGYMFTDIDGARKLWCSNALLKANNDAINAELEEEKSSILREIHAGHSVKVICESRSHRISTPFLKRYLKKLGFNKPKPGNIEA